MKIKMFLIIVGLMMVMTTVKATSSGLLLQEPVGARQTAMGEASVAVGGEINTMFYNSAGLAGIADPQISSMVSLDAFEQKQVYLGMAAPVQWFGKGAIALSLISLLGPEMSINYLDGSSESVVSQQDYVLSIGYGHRLSEKLHVGATVKGFYSTLIEEYDAMAVAVDMGMIYKFEEVKGLSFGLAMQNTGNDIVYDTEGDPMPTGFRTGAAYQRQVATGQQLCMAVDLVFPVDDSSYQHLGIEYTWRQTVFVRAGYKIGYDLDSFTAGAGVKLDNIHVDYAFTMRDIAESIHRIGVSYSFKVN